MKDLTIDLGADRPGMLAKAFETIAKADINVDGYAEIGGTPASPRFASLFRKTQRCLN